MVGVGGAAVPGRLLLAGTEARPTVQFVSFESDLSMITEKTFGIPDKTTPALRLCRAEKTNPGIPDANI